MTVADVPNFQVYNGDDANTTFGFSFRTQLAGDINAFLLDAADLETILVKDTDFAVTLNPDGTGDVDYPISGDPLAAGDKLIVKRISPIDQLLDLKRQGAYSPESYEDEYDKLTLILQQLAEIGDRSIVSRESDVPGGGAGSFDMNNRKFTNVVVVGPDGTAVIQNSDGDGTFEIVESNDPGGSQFLFFIGGSSAFEVNVNEIILSQNLCMEENRILWTNPCDPSLYTEGDFRTITMAYDDPFNASVGVILEFYHDSTSPEIDDTVAFIWGVGNNSVNVRKTYGAIHVQIKEPLDGSEEGQLAIETFVGGVPTRIVEFDQRGLTILQGGLKGVGVDQLNDVDSHSGDYTLLDTDAGKLLRSTGAASADWTVNTSVFTKGQFIEVVQEGTGQVTFVGSATIITPTTLKTNVEGSTVRLTFIDDGDNAVLSQDIAAI